MLNVITAMRQCAIHRAVTINFPQACVIEQVIIIILILYQCI